MSALHRIAGAAALLLCCACARPTEVELRLHACALAGEIPVEVELEIRGLDAEGAPLPVLRQSYPVEPEALADGYATVGLRKPEGMVEADFTIEWHDGRGGVEVVELLHRPVPAAGEVLELRAERCMPLDPGTSSSSGDGTSTGSSSTTDASSSSSGAGTSTSTTDDTTTSSTGDTDASTGDTTGEPTIVGTPCEVNAAYYCEQGGPGQIGTLLECPEGVWEVGNLDKLCGKIQFDINCPDTLGLKNPMPVGCSGLGQDGLTCVCKDTPPAQCDPPSCGEGETITLCDGDERARAVCSVHCAVIDGQPICVDEMP